MTTSPGNGAEFCLNGNLVESPPNGETGELRGGVPRNACTLRGSEASRGGTATPAWRGEVPWCDAPLGSVSLRGGVPRGGGGTGAETTGGGIGELLLLLRRSV